MASTDDFTTRSAALKLLALLESILNDGERKYNALELEIAMLGSFSLKTFFTRGYLTSQ